MNINISFIQVLILSIPLSLIAKGVYYFIISNSNSSSKIRNYSVIKTDNNLEFAIKNKFMSKAYLFIGVMVTTFFTIFNIAYQSNSFKRVMSVLIITFIIDILTDTLGKIKCQINDYDEKNKKKEDVIND